MLCYMGWGTTQSTPSFSKSYMHLWCIELPHPGSSLHVWNTCRPSETTIPGILSHIYQHGLHRDWELPYPWGSIDNSSVFYLSFPPTSLSTLPPCNLALSVLLTMHPRITCLVLPVTQSFCLYAISFVFFSLSSSENRSLMGVSSI